MRSFEICSLSGFQIHKVSLTVDPALPAHPQGDGRVPSGLFPPPLRLQLPLVRSAPGDGSRWCGPTRQCGCQCGCHSDEPPARRGLPVVTASFSVSASPTHHVYFSARPWTPGCPHVLTIVPAAALTPFFLQRDPRGGPAGPCGPSMLH